MQKKSIKDVHIRTGKAHREGDSNLKGVLYKGFSIEVIETKSDGEEINGNSTWFKDKNGDWYWSGGFERDFDEVYKKEKNISKDFNQHVDYTHLVKIKNGLAKIYDKTPLIAVLDTGIHKHHDLNNVIIERRSFVDGESNTDENTGHGTFMAGLIAANTELTNGITGVYPGCRILDLKVLKNDGSEDIKAIKKALEFLIKDNEFNPEIINMSLSISDFDYLKQDIEKLINKGVLVVCAAGEENIFQYDKIALLARNQGVISVGATSHDYLNNANSVFPSGLDFIFANDSQWSTFKQPEYYYDEKGDSVYTAIISALLARELSSGSRNPLKDLSQKSFSLSDYEPNSLKVYKND